MKRILLTLMTLLGITGSAMAQDISVPDTRIAQARKNVLQVTLASSDVNRDLQFDLTLPEGITLVGEGETVLDAATGHVISYNAQEDGSIRFAIVDALMNGEQDAASASPTEYGKPFADGVLVEIPVLAAADFTGTKVAYMKNIHTSTDAGADVEIADGDFNIIMNLLGDVNEDGKVNVTDILVTADYIMTGITPEFKNRGAADIDGGDVINVTDILGIADIIMTNDPSSSAKGYAEEIVTEVEDTLDPQ